MYGVLLRDHTPEEAVDEFNCLMDYIRILYDKVEELEGRLIENGVEP